VLISPNGEVTVTVNRLEFGQGVQTALPMILAEELDADWNLVRSQHGSNDAAYDLWGSFPIRPRSASA
jgi:isoquinoline 1-oxidoreductase beta subunit